MKALLLTLLLFLALSASPQSTNRTPLLRAYLQSNVDGNALGLTNAALVAATNITTLYLAATNGLLVHSNSWTVSRTLGPGDNLYTSSNGVPHVIWADQAGTLYTNRLVPAIP